jgi:hypothetical protein
MQTQQPLTVPSFTYGGASPFVVPRSQVADAWPEIERHIARVENVPWSSADVLDELEAGRAQAWGMRRGNEVLGFWLTRIENAYTTRYGVVWIVAGTGLDLGLPVWPVVEQWFWDQGCQFIELHGRKGWKRVLPDYDEVAVVLRKRRP